MRGADVAILPDHDETGRNHAEAVAASLQDIAERVRVLDLPDLADKGDVVDWVKAGGTREQLDALVEQAPEWQPAKQQIRGIGNKSLSAKELNAMRFEPIKYVVPGIIVEGLTLLAAKPKMGKSWMMLHASVAVARGGFTLGDIHCIEGDALYCALEDNLRRLQSRMTKLLGTEEWPARLFFFAAKCRGLLRAGCRLSRIGSRVPTSRAWSLSIPWQWFACQRGATKAVMTPIIMP